MPLSALTLRGMRVGIGIFLVGLLLMPVAARAEGEDPAVIERVTNLNKKALDAYNNLEFEDARKLLKQALDLCSSSGLDKHPVKARTHVHMGVVLIANKQQELGIKQFRKALEIQPDIQVTKALANPEIVQAFEEAGSGGGGGGGASDASEGGGGETAGGASAGASSAEVTGDISLVPVTRGKKGKAVAISATVSAELTGYTKVVLAYRAEGAPEFIGVDMRKSGNRYVGEIPAEATAGGVVNYYVEAEAEDETPVATNGSEEKPYTVYLTAGGGGGRGGGAASEGAEEEDEGGPKFFLSLAGGTGIGYTTGNGELNADNKVKAGFAPASAGQIVPEVGYFLMPNFRLSVQFRVQYVTGRTPINLNELVKVKPSVNVNSCGTDRICSTGSPIAPAVFVRGSWFFGKGLFRPYFSLAAGAGIIRHVVTFNDAMSKVCGSDGKQACVDSVLSGPVFVGPGGGLFLNIAPSFGVLAEVNTVLGFPKFTYNLDFNLGVALRL